MEDYNVSDYGIFESAVNSANTLRSSIDSDITDVRACRQNLADDTIFMGPICDSCIDGFDRMNGFLSTLSESLNTLSSYLIDVAVAYKNGDEKAANKFLRFNSGKLSVSSGAKPSGNANRDYIFEYLSNLGLNEAAISGIMANIKRETNFKTDIGGDGGTSYGMCGWHLTRWDSLKAFCEQNNYDVSQIEGQTAYLVYELQNKYTDLYNFLLNVPNTSQGAYDAASQFCIQFERPANTYDRAEERGNIAVSEYFPFYTT
ncbi:MAG: hypothetical protein IJG68_04615 [Bacilli bacterium]|nr:hypothetical protein [Bacilli bacterium]